MKRTYLSGFICSVDIDTKVVIVVKFSFTVCELHPSVLNESVSTGISARIAPMPIQVDRVIDTSNPHNAPCNNYVNMCMKI